MNKAWENAFVGVCCLHRLCSAAVGGRPAGARGLLLHGHPLRHSVVKGVGISLGPFFQLSLGLFCHLQEQLLVRETLELACAAPRAGRLGLESHVKGSYGLA